MEQPARRLRNGASLSEGPEGTDEQDLVQFGRPGTRVREDVEEGADEGARVLVVLRRERPHCAISPAGARRSRHSSEKYRE